MSIPDDADKNIGDNLRRADKHIARGESGDAEPDHAPHSGGAGDEDDRSARD